MLREEGEEEMLRQEASPEGADKDRQWRKIRSTVCAEGDANKTVTTKTQKEVYRLAKTLNLC